MNAQVPVTADAGAEGELQIGGESFFYRESGRGEPMVLVHANLSDLRSWSALEPLLAPDYRVISYSRRFAFPNRQPARIERDSLEAHVDDLEQVIGQLGRGPVHLVGNSSGAFVCLLLARRRPDLVRTLTLEEPPVVSMFFRSVPPRAGEAIRLLFRSPAALFDLATFGARSIGPALKAFEAGNDERAVGIFLRGVIGDAAYGGMTPDRRQQARDNTPAHRALMLGAGLPVFTAADAAAITVPTQLVHGQSTPSFQRRINRRLASLIPGAREVAIADASHLVHEDDPQAVADAIGRFCREHQVTAASGSSAPQP